MNYFDRALAGTNMATVRILELMFEKHSNFTGMG